LSWANPFATLAVIDPDWPVVWSRISVTSPAAESWTEISSESPAPIKRSRAAFGVNDASVWLSGAGGACGVPLLVMNAKFAGSTLTVFRQAALLFTPVFWLRLKLKIAIAAHHCVASQLIAFWNGTHPGG
jgi:hypothetical protein